MSDHPSDRPRRSSRRRDQERNKVTSTSENPQKHNGKPPFAASSREKDTNQVNNGSGSGRKNRVDPLPQNTANDDPVEQRGRGDTVEDEVKSEVAEEGKPSKIRRRKGTPTPSLRRAVAQTNDPTTAQRITRLPQRPKPQQPTAAQRQQTGSTSGQKNPEKIHRTRNERSHSGRVSNEKRAQSAPSTQGRRGRSPAREGNEKPRHESRGRSYRRSNSTGDRNRSRTRSQSVKRHVVKVFLGENKRDESPSRVITEGASILLWNGRGNSADVQLRLKSISAGNYRKEDIREEDIIYLRVSVDVNWGKIESLKHLFIKLQMRCPCCEGQWRLVTYSPKIILGHNVPVDCKDTRADEYGAEAGGSGGGAEAKVTGKRMNGRERQYNQESRYELRLTEANNILTSHLETNGDTVATRPPSYFNLQMIAAPPPCRLKKMQITADLVLNESKKESKADGSWRPVPIRKLKDRCNFGDLTEADWKKHGGCESFEIK